MAGLVPAIHVFLSVASKSWMPGTSPGMTRKRYMARAFESFDAMESLNRTAVGQARASRKTTWRVRSTRAHAEEKAERAKGPSDQLADAVLEGEHVEDLEVVADPADQLAPH